MSELQAVVFDLDGVIIDSEQVWDQVRRQYASERGRPWTPAATRAMQGMSSVEWSAYMANELGISEDPAAINEGVVAEMLEAYETSLPLIPGACEAVERMAAHWPLGLASSSNRPIIDTVLGVSGLVEFFEVTLSSEETGGAGKPAPDVYLEACRRLGVEPYAAAAIEDSTNGLRSAYAAGMRVVAIPNREYPPDAAALAESADVVLGTIGELSPAEIV